MIFLIFFLFLESVVYAQFPNGRKLESPIPDLCRRRIVHERSPAGKNYFFSWRDLALDKEDWLGARNFCRMRCMDAVSLETEAENKWIKDFIKNESAKEVWTSGRLCDFKGCDRKDLLPVEINGWFWTAIFKKLSPTYDRERNDWSEGGVMNKPQPDNSEYIFSGKPENCLAILDDLYDDGIHWHDVVCSKRRFFACEDSSELLAYVRYVYPELRI